MYDYFVSQIKFVILTKYDIGSNLSKPKRLDHNLLKGHSLHLNTQCALLINTFEFIIINSKSYISLRLQIQILRALTTYTNWPYINQIKDRS